jgi:clan AA aspartic protease
MKCYFDKAGTPRVHVTVMGSRAATDCEALIDTGFDGDITIPLPTAIQLGLEFTDATEVELADGTVKDEMVFSGAIRWNGEERAIRIMLTSSEEALLGRGLLQGKPLAMDFRADEIKIENDSS